MLHLPTMKKHSHLVFCIFLLFYNGFELALTFIIYELPVYEVTSFVYQVVSSKALYGICMRYMLLCLIAQNSAILMLVQTVQIQAALASSKMGSYYKLYAVYTCIMCEPFSEWQEFIINCKLDAKCFESIKSMWGVRSRKIPGIYCCQLKMDIVRRQMI